MDKPPITVMIVEDQAITRLGLKLVLDQEEGIEIVAESGDGNQAVEFALQFRPNVILMDVGLPGLDGIAATRAIKQEYPNARIVMFTSHDEDQSVFAAFAAGADGYCLKDAPQESLVAAITSVAQGHVWLDRSIAGKVLAINAVQPSQAAVRDAAEATGGTSGHRAKVDDTAALEAGKSSGELFFNSQELDILKLIVDGNVTREIALNLSLDITNCQELMRQLVEKLERSQQAQRALALLRGAPKADSLPSGKASRSDSSSVQMEEPRSALLMAPGSTFADRYEIMSMLGKGGASFVYKAKHKHIGRVVAIKTLRQDQLDDEVLVRRFEREAKAASSLEHPNIIHVYDFGTTAKGQSFLVMDYLEGASLEKFLLDRGPLNANLFRDIFVQVLDALAFAHERHVLHRDLKPANIMLVNKGGGSPLVKLVDFGIARLLQDHADGEGKLTRTGEVVGTPLYMSPEQYMGRELDCTSDLYSLGCTMYESLAGIAAFSGSTLYEILSKHMNEYPAPPSRANPTFACASEFDAMVMTLIAKEVDKRFQSAQETKEALLAAVV